MTVDVEPAKGGVHKKPFRMTNLVVAANVPVIDEKKDLKFGDLKAGSILWVQLESVWQSGMTIVTGIRVEGATEKKPDEKEKPEADDEAGGEGEPADAALEPRKAEAPLSPSVGPGN
jgi:hypothetical protein